MPWASEESFAIPTGYGDDRIVLMVKDPWWLFAYWEIQPSTERAARGRLLPHEVAGLQSILRVYDVTGVDDPASTSVRAFDIGLSGLATNWYIHVGAPNHAFLVEIGLLTTAARFLPLARSNRVTTPRFGPSDVLDEEWMTTDEAYWKLAGALADVRPGGSPGAWSRGPARALSSGAWSSTTLASRHRAALAQGFWCRVHTELILHGATEPRATVVVQGQSVSLRRDGTFSLRMAIPDGTQAIAIEITSPDGRQTRAATPIVTLAWGGWSVPGSAGSSPPPEALTRAAGGSARGSAP